MESQNAVIYQSGQKVQTDGWYVPVGAPSSHAKYLKTDEVFPNEDGRAGCWVSQIVTGKLELKPEFKNETTKAQ